MASVLHMVKALWRSHWLSRVFIIAGVVGLLGVLVLALAGYYLFKSTDIEPDQFFESIFDAPAVSVSGLTGEGSQWQDVNAWIRFAADHTPPVKAKWPLRPCAKPDEVRAYFVFELERKGEGGSGLQTAQPVSCQEWTETDVLRGLWILHDSTAGLIYVRYWWF